RVPGGHGTRVVDEFEESLGLPVQVENDARAGALGEFIARDESIPDLIYVKAGTGIGAGLISRGQLVHGGAGVAGDITHVPVPGAGGRQCSCARPGCLATVASAPAIRGALIGQGLDTSSSGAATGPAQTSRPDPPPAAARSGNTGCLETVASGAAIRRELIGQGLDISSIGDVTGLAQTFQPDATTAVRRSGKQLGTALSSLVNFLNPSAVVLGGALSGVDAY